MNERFYAVILAGGRGERFWPLSTASRPKQLLALLGRQTLLAEAVDRLRGLVPPERTLVVTSAGLVDACRRAAPLLPPGNVIGEPVGRDTAAAVALGAALVGARCPGGAFCVLTADQVMGDLDVFRATLRESLVLAMREDVLVTIGIEPRSPDTSFGYIETADPLFEASGVAFLRAARFVEKPDAATAADYVASGRFLWNAGMFAWSLGALERAFSRHAPHLLALRDRLREAARQGEERFAAVLKAAYEPLPRRSIDYALMEQADNIVVARGAFAWDDVGSWPALTRHLPADADGNVREGRVATLDAQGNLVVSRGRVTALLGVRDLVVVQAEGATLVCPRDRAGDLKKLVQALREDGGFEDVL